MDGSKRRSIGEGEKWRTCEKTAVAPTGSSSSAGLAIPSASLARRHPSEEQRPSRGELKRRCAFSTRARSSCPTMLTPEHEFSLVGKLPRSQKLTHDPQRWPGSVMSIWMRNWTRLVLRSERNARTCGISSGCWASLSRCHNSPTLIFRSMSTVA